MNKRRRRYRLVAFLFLLGLGTIFIISCYYPKVTQVEVYYGYKDTEPYYSKTYIKTQTDIYEGKSFFSISRRKLRKFASDPWIEKLRVIRHWPDKVTVIVWERKPAIVYHQEQNANILYALDGTMLPNVKELQEEKLISISGWGKSSLKESLKLIKLLAEFRPKVLNYSPSGFDITLNHSQLFTPNLEVLKRHWGAFSSEQHRYQEAQGINVKPLAITIYEWGISVE